MNIIDVQDQLKNFSEDQLINEMQMPSGNAPQFLVLSEIQRRKRMRDDFAKREAAQQQTVAEEAIAAAGVPVSGIAGMSEAMAPQSAASGGIGSVMPQSMKQAAPQSLPSPTDDPIEMRSGGLMAYGQELSQRLAQKKQGKVDRFLDNVEQQAVSEFGFEAAPETGGQGDENKQAVMDETLDLDMFSDLFAPSNKGGGITPRPAVMYGSPYARPISYYSEGGVIKAQDGLPLGLRQRNPGNIRPGAGFIGESGAGSGYSIFDSDDEGLRAIQRLLMTYGDEYGLNTIRGLANRYAPKSENPTESYIDFLSKETGIGPDEEIDLAGRGSDLIPAIVGFEQGQQPFSQAQIDRAIKAAGTDDEDEVKEIFSQPLSGDESIVSKALSAINPISSAQASTLTPTAQPVTTPMPDIPQQIIRDETGRPIGDASYGPRIRAAMETGNEDIADRLVAQGVVDANFFEQQYKNMDPDDLGNLEQDSVTAGMGALTTPIGSGTLDPGQIAQVLSIDPEKSTVRGGLPSVRNTKANAATTDDKNKKPATTTPNVTLSNAADAKSGVTSLEDEIKKLQSKMEKDRETDKYLALAQAGLALMSSKEPTLLGAVGEAGISGLKAMREAQQRYDEGVIDLINARSKLAKSGDTNILSKDVLLREAINLETEAAKPENFDSKDSLLSRAAQLRGMAGVPAINVADVS